MIKIYFDIEPKSQQSVRVCKAGDYIRKYQPKQTLQWKHAIRSIARGNIPHDFKPYDGAVILNVLYVFQPIKTLKKGQKEWIEKGGLVMKTTKPDISDNLNKGLCDALTGILWTDDARIVDIRATKAYGKRDGIYLVADEEKCLNIMSPLYWEE